jgi:two-component system, NarL family, response regulator DevR
MYHPPGSQPVPAPAATVPAQLTVFLLDDHEAVRSGVRSLLDAEPGITVIGEAGTATSALARIPALRPDVAVLDVRLPDGDGVTVCRELRSLMPALACLMLTAHDESEALFDTVMAGAAGYVLKQIRGPGLAGAVRAVAAGQPVLDPEAAGTMVARIREARRPGPPAGAAGNEDRVLELIGEGLTNRQIAERMVLDEKTVKDHATALYTRLGMERRTQAAAHVWL